METPQAGLDLAAWIRDDLKNSIVRIILRTGQPGEAPEQEVIFKYDINDYKEKAELTSQKLCTTVTAAIRSYQDIRTIERNPAIFKTQSLSNFASGVLTQLASTICLDDDTLIARASGFAAAKRNGNFRIIASTGKFEKTQGLPIDYIEDPEAINCIKKAAQDRKSFFKGGAFVGYYRTSGGSESIIYLRGANPIRDDDQKLIEIFSSNISVAFDNIDLNQIINKTQEELLFTLGEVMETRSAETANHIRRVSEYSRILALKAGLNQEDANQIKIASTMHDVGKIGIPDTILLKPDKLNSEEFETIKKHSRIGHDILAGSEHDVMNIAATMALQHHEKWDGSGYPNGLKGEEIDIVGRIITLADVFDSLSCKRVYKEAWLLNDILDFVQKQRGKMFDPGLVDLLMENLDDFLKIRNQYPDDNKQAAGEDQEKDSLDQG